LITVTALKKEMHEYNRTVVSLSTFYLHSLYIVHGVKAHRKEMSISLPVLCFSSKLRNGLNLILAYCSKIVVRILFRFLLL
jgi:hypothetical protein